MYKLATSADVCSFKRDIKNRPTAMISVPATGKILYRPVLPTIVPAAIDVINRPATRGSIRTPELVADTPLTYCKNVGKNVIDPSIAKPTTNASALHTENTRLENSRIGKIGSTARRSTTTNTAKATTDTPINPSTCTDPHAYVVPPQLVASVSPPAPIATNTIPAQSMIGRAVARTAGIVTAAIATTTTAIGTFT